LVLLFALLQVFDLLLEFTSSGGLDLRLLSISLIEFLEIRVDLLINLPNGTL
jgi:hypothetical protein